MNITVFYTSGRGKRSCTQGIAALLIKELRGDGEVFTFHLPRDMPHVCSGCYTCIAGRESCCPGAAALAPILDAIARSELLIFCVPTYVFHVPGQMKALLDHFSYRWMIHRPDLSMMRKQAVIVNTAGGGGMRRTVRELRDSLDYWGVARTCSRRRSGTMTGRRCRNRSVRRLMQRRRARQQMSATMPRILHRRCACAACFLFTAGCTAAAK